MDIDEDQEMENFGTEKDFEGGQWVNGEFYFRKRREKARTQTKDDVIYGVFGDSEDYHDDGYSSKKRRKDFGRKQDLTKPVNFVSTGNFMPDKDNVDENLKEQDDGEEDRPGLGLGFGSASISGSGLGFNAGRGVNGSDRNEESDENDNRDDKFLPTAFGKMIKERAMKREKERLEEKKKNGNKPDIGLGQEGAVDVGKFESHTKGIGMKLLEKMGYKGGGLGKNEQGILNPIEAKLRAKNSGLGFNESKGTTMPLPVLQTEKKTEPGVVQPTVGRTRSWLKPPKKKNKEEEKYVTAKELLASKQEEESEVVQKIYDMRGPQVRVLTDLSDLNAEEKAKENDVPMPELQYNVALIVRIAESNIQEIDRDLRKERDIALSLKKEKEKLEAEAAFQKKQLDNYEKIMSVLDRVGEENTLGTLTLLNALRTCTKDLLRIISCVTCHALLAHMLCLCLSECSKDGILFEIHLMVWSWYHSGRHCFKEMIVLIYGTCHHLILNWFQRLYCQLSEYLVSILGMHGILNQCYGFWSLGKNCSLLQFLLLY
jgi:tuftelin-interacting protein 11